MKLKCGICFDDESGYGDQETNRDWQVTRCGHCYHSNCLEQYRNQPRDPKSKETCPNCRTQLNRSKLIKIYGQANPASSSSPVRVPVVEEEEETDEKMQADIIREMRNSLQQAKEKSTTLEAELTRMKAAATRQDAQLNSAISDKAEITRQRDQMRADVVSKETMLRTYVEKQARHKREVTSLTNELNDATAKLQKVEAESLQHLQDIQTDLDRLKTERAELEAAADKSGKEVKRLKGANANFRKSSEKQAARIKELERRLAAASNENQAPSTSRKRQRQDDTDMLPPKSTQRRATSSVAPLSPRRSITPAFQINDRRPAASKFSTADSALLIPDDLDQTESFQESFQSNKSWQPESEPEDEDMDETQGEASFMFKEESFRPSTSRTLQRVDSKLGLPESFVKGNLLELGPKHKIRVKQL